MSGSEMQSKTSPPKHVQLLRKGFSTIYYDDASGHVFRIEGMGDGRYRVHTPKRPPKQK